MTPALSVISDKALTYQQKLAGLARVGEATIDPLVFSQKTHYYIEKGAICNLNEGPAPYRPRYIVPDYEKFMKNGSKFLGLNPPKDIWEATNNLLIIYRHVPSITTFPVYIGDLDTLLEPFIKDEQEAKKAISLFLLQIDRVINDSFCHADIGPKETKAGRIILEVTREQQNAVPNLTLKYDPDITPDDFAKYAAKVALEVAKPSFANHKIFKADFEKIGFDDYAIASCYNGLPKGGGSFTLTRMNLKNASEQTDSYSDFINKVLPEITACQLEYMDERIRFIIEESNFFESSFLVEEGLISLDRFSAMFGVVGLAECVNKFMKGKRFGKDKEADNMGLEIIQKIDGLVKEHHNPLLKAVNGCFLMHAQVGIDTDHGVSPGCRIPIGEEPEIYDHILQSAAFHPYFVSGIGDVFAFEPTTKKNPDYLFDVAKGAMASGLRYFSAYASDADVVRITGYLVKRSEIEKLEKGQASLQGTTAFGRGAVNNLGVLDRRLHPGK